MSAIADTGWIVGFLNARDEHHSWAMRVSHDLSYPLLTCEAVLAEAAYICQSVEAVMDLVAAGMLKVEFDLERHLDSLRKLGTYYRDRKPQLADLCLVRMSELFPRHTVLTTDRKDFNVYRRFRNEPVPFAAPD